MTAFHIRVKYIWFSGKPICWCNFNNLRLTLALTVDDANYFCHCGPSCHLLCKMLSYRTCSSGHILYNAPGARPSHHHQPHLPFLGKTEQRRFTSFRSILIQPFRGGRKWKHLTSAFTPGSHSGLGARTGGIYGEVSFVQSVLSLLTSPWRPTSQLQGPQTCSSYPHPAYRLVSPRGSGTTAIVPQLSSLSPKYSDLNELGACFPVLSTHFIESVTNQGSYRAFPRTYPSCVLHLTLSVENTSLWGLPWTSKSKFNQRSDKMQKESKAVMQDKIITV